MLAVVSRGESRLSRSNPAEEWNRQALSELPTEGSGTAHIVILAFLNEHL